MKETTIQIKTKLEKINAIRMYLSGKDLDLERELSDYIETLYKKHVPAPVREYIEKTDSYDSDEDNNSLPRRTAHRKALNGENGSAKHVDATEE